MNEAQRLIQVRKLASQAIASFPECVTQNAEQLRMHAHARILGVLTTRACTRVNRPTDLLMHEIEMPVNWSQHCFDCSLSPRQSRYKQTTLVAMERMSLESKLPLELALLGLLLLLRE